MKASSLSQKAYALVMFVAVSALAGLLLAGLAVPTVAIGGTAVRTAADSLHTIPAELETPPQSQRSRIIMGNGRVLATFYDENRVYVTLDKISQIMQSAQIDIEDHRFKQHGAIDLQGLGRAFFKTALGDTQGASTLTQQYVKLVQVETAKANGDEAGVLAATEVSLSRKIREMRYAMAVEQKLTKDQILERYLNIAYYGDGAYGVEAAARHYWNTTAAELTLDQAAMLAGIVQNPVAFNPVNHPEKAIDRRDTVINRMLQLGTITAEEAAAAKAVPFTPGQEQPTKNGCVGSQFPFLCDYVYRTLISDKMSVLGGTAEERENLVKRGGLDIRTLINPTAQLAAEDAVAAVISPSDPALSGSVLIQPSTGLIVAMAQSRSVMGTGAGETYWNYNVSSAMGGAEGYQAGSTFKPFTMAAALEQGMTPSKTYVAKSPLDTAGFVWKGCNGTFELPSYDEWKPKNYDNSYGEIDMMTATQKSVNSYYVQLLRDAGLCASVDVAARTGVELASGADLKKEMGSIPSFVLGVADVTPLSLAEAYATFANRGVHCDPIILSSVTSAQAKQIAVPSANCAKVMEPAVADTVNYVLQSVVQKGTASRARLADGRPLAAKTGTTNDAVAVWLAGYTPDLAGVAYIAVDKTAPYWVNHKTKSLSGLKVASGKRLSGSGSGDAGPIFKAAMGAALQGVPETKFTAPTKEALQGVKVKIPSVKGMSYDEAKATLEAAGFTTQDMRVYNSRKKGRYLGITPTGSAPKFSTIYMKISKGPEPVATKKSSGTTTKTNTNTAPAAPASAAAPATPAAAPGNNGNGNGNGNGGTGG